MKKFYSIALAVAVAATASAADNVRKVVNAEVIEHNGSLIRQTVKAEKPLITPMAAASDYQNYTWKLIGDGKYIASVMIGVYGASSEPADVKIYEAEGHEGVYKAVGVWPDKVQNAELIVDASNPEFITVPKQNSGIVDQVDRETYISSQTWFLTEEKGYTAADVKAQVPEIIPSVKDGIITFPAKSLVLNWPNAPEDSQFGTDPTAWYTGADDEGCLVLPGATYVEPWKLLGTGRATGDIYFQVFGATPADYTVQVYQSTSNENLYRITNPLAGLYNSFGWQSTSPKWEIDVTDANNITLPLTTSGINGGDEEGVYYAATVNQIYGTIAECPEANRASVRKEPTKTTFNFPTQSLVLLAATSQTAYYGNRTDASITVEHEAMAIDGITADTDADAPVEYFNLQGVRISRPAAGQIVIKRQGSKVTKILAQ